MHSSDTPSQHSVMLRDSVSDFVARATSMARVRRMRAEKSECDSVLWRNMAQLGWLGILVTEQFGGSGLGLAEAAIVAEGLAAALTPEPFNAVAIMAATVLVHSDESALRERLLSQLVSGELRPALAWQEQAGEVDVGALDAQAGRFESGYKLQGTKRFVAGASGANGFVVSARDASGPAIYWLPNDSPGLKLELEPLPDGRQFGTLAMNDVLVARSHRLAAGEAARSALETARDYATIVAGAELLGVMGRALDMTLEYMRTRVQFGKPIGSFQALQHRAVDLYVQQQIASAVLEDGLRRVGEADGAGARAALASRVKARCSEAAMRIVKETIQMHGAIGFTDEYDAGLYLKRAMVLAAWLGNSALHRRRYARFALEAEV